MYTTSTSGRQATSSEVLRTTSASEDKENEAGFSTDDEEEATPLVVLSVIFQGNQLGAAYYDIDTCCLHLMPDHNDTAPSYSLLRLLLKQTNPCTIVTSSRTDENVVSILKEINSRNLPTVSSSSSFPSPQQRVHLLPNSDFAIEASKHRLKNLQLSKMPQNMNDTEKRIYFSSLIDFTSIFMVKAAGGLLKFIDSNPFGLRLSNDFDFETISSISTLALNNIVNLDDNSYKALQIFQEERHPSVYKSSFGIKEGLSLFGICNNCKSAIGKKELRRWFLFPSNDPKLLLERQAAVKYFSSPKNDDVRVILQGSLKHIKFLPRILSRMKTAQASMNDWQSLYKTAYYAMLIGETCRSRSSSLDIFKQIDATFSSDLFRITSLLNKIIDFDEYAKQNHFIVKPGVDSELDKMKRTYNGLPDFMTQVAYQELQDLSVDVQQCSVIYLPQLGYLLSVPATEAMKESKDYSIPNLRFMFIVNDIVHYKSANTRKLDSILGDTLCDIYDKETQIMHKLQNVILEMRHVLFDVMEYSAKLDCLISLAVTAKECNWIQPEISTDGQMAIIKGRHPLQEMCVSSYVANDAFSGGSESKIKVITGPNSSGKSIYLKQIALIVFMTHLGSFVPAQTAKIPMVDKIFTCMHVVESVSLNLSGFLISLNQFCTALNGATEKSFVVIDEFGKDTEVKSGLFLLASSLQYWIERKGNSPHILLATHYLTLDTFFPQCPFIKFQTMDIIQDKELVFLYQVVNGISKSSFAFKTALKAGLPKNVVERNLEIVQNLKHKQPISLTDPDTVYETLKRYIFVYDEFLKLDVASNNMQGFFAFVKDAGNISAASEPVSSEKS
ncbi:hypothetical protein JTE90_008457 [Oedothorax gibbosus]|uniref:DNA mismatch repair proteins mutS family domain-containing protein n=1 Tax=Oedothorax gibbosus TaxID=931172 RepID=A0AAV6UYC4_9ARAC|nr:hypothetical protein JTE90_008457 [Oedothorax gibbosus]